MSLLWLLLFAATTRSSHFKQYRKLTAYKQYNFDSHCLQVRRDKFLIFQAEHGFEHCAGLGHISFAIRCLLNEAMHTQRVAVLPDRLCLHPVHNGGVQLVDGAQLSSYWDWSRLPCAIAWTEFVQLNDDGRFDVFDDVRAYAAYELVNVSMSHMRSHLQSTFDLASRDDLKDVDIVRRFDFGDKHWWMACHAQPPAFHRVTPPARQHLALLAAEIAEKIGPFVFVHVRRGDKAAKNRYYDKATQPQSILVHLRRCVDPARYAIYIASDEFEPHFFDVVRETFQVHKAEQFAEQLRSVLEPQYNASDYQRAAQERAQFLNVQIAETEPTAYEPVLMDNNLLFLWEKKLSSLADGMMCTEPQRCKHLRFNETLLTPKNDNNEKKNRCQWSLIAPENMAKSGI